MFNNDEILTVQDLMQLLYIGKNTAYKLLSSGEIPSFKIGRIYRIPRKIVEEYVVKKCTGI